VACWSQDQAARSERTDDSKDWKSAGLIFPSIGQFRGNFSKAWKNIGDFFKAWNCGRDGREATGGRGFYRTARHIRLDRRRAGAVCGRGARV